MELSGTARVILGFLCHEPMSGYDIKQLADKSTRFFWAASYGQIYPELRRLAEKGLVEGSEETTGDRRRRVFRLTARGRELVDSWLEDPQITYELRDEGMLKHFLGDFARPEATIRTLEQKRRFHLERIEELHEVEPLARDYALRFPLRSLRFGLEYHRWSADWCEREAEVLRRELAGDSDETTDDEHGGDR